MTFVLTSAFVILVFWRPQEWLVPQLYGWPILDAIVYASVLTLLLEIGNKAVTIPRGPAVFMIAGLWFSTIMSHVAHTYFAGLMASIPETGKICFFTLLLVCVLDRPSRVRFIAVLFVAAACLMSVHALMQYYQGAGFLGHPPLLTVKPRTGEPVVRTLFFGIFSDPNDMAQILATALPFVFAIPRRWTLGAVLFCGAMATLILWAFFTTHSRGGMVALATVITLTIVLKLPARWLPYASIVLLAGSLGLIAAKASLLLDPSAHDRVVFWGLANQQFKANPIFGIGYGMFWQVASDRASHNAFVSCYTELGVFGYWFWFGFLTLGILGCWRSRKILSSPKTPDEAFMRRFAGAAIVATAAFCASAYFLTRAWVYPMFFLMALMNAVANITEDMVGHKEALINPRRDLMITNTLGTFGSIGYIYLTIIILNRAYY